MIMGLGSNEVGNDGFEWSQGMVKRGGDLEIPRPAVAAQPTRQQQQKQRQQPTQQQGPPLRCPRCDSANTKFCYFNNYSRSQPRHFCKACRRHWTDGGTLRNVPVGGGRKAKRPKTSHPSSAADPTTDTHSNRVDHSSTVPTIQPPQPLLPPLTFAPDMLCPAALLPPDYANSSYLGSLLSLPPAPQFVGATPGLVDGGGYPFSSTSSSFPLFLSLTGQDDLAGLDAGTTVTDSMATPPPWELPPPPTCSSGLSGSTITTTSSGLTPLETSSPSSAYWGSCWDDLAGLLSPDFKHPPASTPPPPPQYFQLS